MAPRVLEKERLQEVKVLFALLMILPTAAQNQPGSLVVEVLHFPQLVRNSNVHAAVLKSGRVIWEYGKIAARAPEQPVIAERVPAALLDTPAPIPSGATIRQVLSHTADGTPGEEVLENRQFFEALKPIAGRGPLPNALKFATEEHGTLGWFAQEHAGTRLLWSYGPSVLLVRVPSKSLTLVVSGDLKAARLQDGNVLRSRIALMFLRDMAKLGSPGADDIIAVALDLLYSGQRDEAVRLVHLALEGFPGLESTPDVTLLYLFAQLGMPETETSATAVLKDHPSLPTAWFYYGQYLENSKRYREAAACFEKITMHQ